jgi:hypothetical protein
MQNLQICNLVLVFLNTDVFSLPTPQIFAMAQARPRNPARDKDFARRSFMDVTIHPTYRHLRWYSKGYTNDVCREMNNLLNWTENSPPEITLQLAVCSPSWIAIQATNKLKKKYPHRYNNKTQYPIQPVCRTPGFTPPPYPKVLLKALAKFGLKDPTTTNKHRPDQQFYVVPKQRAYVAPQHRPDTPD